MRLKGILLFCCVWLWISTGGAQEISVVRFHELEKDLDALANYPVRDQNGKKCALLKIVTTEKGFTFDVGQLGVVKTLQKTAEIWVYVPEKVNRIKISHPQLGQIKSPDGFYWFPDGAVRSAACYRLEISTAEIETTIKDREIKTGWVIFESEPSGADVYINDVLRGKTPISNLKLPYGEYTYRVEKNMYHPELGLLQIKSNRTEYNHYLKPAFGSLTIESNPNARVVVEGLYKELMTPCRYEELPSGEYTVRISQEKYTTSVQHVTIEDGKNTTLNVKLDALFAHVIITSLPNAVIYINEEKTGISSCEVDLIAGVYDIKVELESHKSIVKQIQVESQKDMKLSIAPIPLYGDIDILSEPHGAMIYVDGKEIGKTPNTIKTLIGKHTIKIKNDGYVPLEKEIEVVESKNPPITGILELNKGIQLSSNNEVFSGTGGVKKVQVTGIDGWSVQSDLKWCDVTVKHNSIVLDVTRNKDNSMRAGTVRVYSYDTSEMQTIIVSQNQLKDNSIRKYRREYGNFDFYFAKLAISSGYTKIESAGTISFKARFDLCSFRFKTFEFQLLSISYDANFKNLNQRLLYEPTVGLMFPISNKLLIFRGGPSWTIKNFDYQESIHRSLGGCGEISIRFKFTEFYLHTYVDKLAYDIHVGFSVFFPSKL